MFKTLFLTLVIVAVALGETRFQPANGKGLVVAPGNEVSHPFAVKGLNTRAVPPDNGGNYGDNLWRNRVSGDVLLTTEIQINPIAGVEQSFNWNGNFPGRKISHMRFLNIGRQRAWIESVSSAGGPTASAVIRVAPNYQFRLLIEVYGK